MINLSLIFDLNWVNDWTIISKKNSIPNSVWVLFEFYVSQVDRGSFKHGFVVLLMQKVKF